ncbi:MAG TPA: LLM class F420-dependent oxidoreductase [Acidimicrobiales bacterium]|nr:LLM class F420-dependent oxidoreductase [Acidimicrobiales bacterium]
MDLGITMFPTDYSIGPARLAAEVENRGFRSLWFPEHTHIPVGRKTPYPAGGELPQEYSHTLDPFVALGVAAAVTERLLLGTGVCLVAQHDPIVLAKEVATLDLVSGGRFMFGIGVGWNEDEMEDHGVDPARRRAVVREKVLAMKALWTQDEASFDGEFVRFPPSWSWPKPVQQPHPPVLMGGAGGPVTFRHVIEYCDGWMPISGRADVARRSAELREEAAAAGRDPASLRLHVFGGRPDAEVLDHYQEAGADGVILWLPPASEDKVLAMLDRYDALVARYR